MLIREDLVKQNHHEHNVAIPKVRIVVENAEFINCIKNTLNSSPTLHQKR